MRTGTGEITYPAIARSLHDEQYAGTIRLEGWAAGESERALQRFCDPFNIEEFSGSTRRNPPVALTVKPETRLYGLTGPA